MPLRLTGFRSTPGSHVSCRDRDFRPNRRRNFDDDNYEPPPRNFGYAPPRGPQFDSPSGPTVTATVKWYLERDRFIELELRSAIQAGERLTHQGELDQQHVVRLTRGVVTRCAMDRIDMAVGEQGSIELGGFFSVAIEPEARGYARHGNFLLKAAK